MPIDTDFGFAHQLTPHLGAGLRATATADLLGPLRGFVGTHKQRRWSGSGFNMLWRPHRPQSGERDFFLELNLTTETLDFTDITGTGVANRGLRQGDIALGAIAYLQQIDDRKLGPQHFEPGVWINIPATIDPAEPATVARMGSIPHGTTINLQGTATDLGNVAPTIPKASITPFAIGSSDDGATGLVHFPEETGISTALPARTAAPDVPGLDDAHLADPNLFLRDANAGLAFISTTEIRLISTPLAPQAPPAPPPPTAPDIGGGAASIAFLVGKPAPNAFVERVTATFWLQQVKTRDGRHFAQLQYSQRVLLNFSGLSWPHISVATLHLQG